MPFEHQCKQCARAFVTERRASQFCSLKCSCAFNQGLHFTEHQRHEILRLRDELDWGLQRIARKMGCTKAGIRAFLRRAGITIEHKPPCNVGPNGERAKPRPKKPIWERLKTMQRIQTNAWAQEQRHWMAFDESRWWGNHALVKRWQDRRKDQSQRERKTNYYFSKCLRRRVYRVLNGQLKSAPTLELLGCSIGELRLHLKKQFKRGMTWENYGTVWHIDHKEPCSSFDLSNPEDQRRCFHFSNLQPLLATENRHKWNTIVPTQRELIFRTAQGRAAKGTQYQPPPSV